MDLKFFSTPTGIAVIAAGGSFLAGLLGGAISSWTVERIHRQRVAADERLAERKFEFDKQLAEHKLDAEIAIAQKKFTLDRQLSDHKHRLELTEEVLADSYSFRTALQAIRSPLLYEGEAKDRHHEGSEDPDLARLRDSYFVHLKRYEQRRNQIDPFLAKRFRMKAVFGPATDLPFDQFHDAIVKVLSAAQMLLVASSENQQRDIDPDSKTKWRNAIIAGASNPDLIKQQVDAAVAELERICRPIQESSGK
jgi:hypothetical protein